MKSMTNRNITVRKQILNILLYQKYAQHFISN